MCFFLTINIGKLQYRWWVYLSKIVIDLKMEGKTFFWKSYMWDDKWNRLLCVNDLNLERRQKKCFFWCGNIFVLLYANVINAWIHRYYTLTVLYFCSEIYKFIFSKQFRVQIRDETRSKIHHLKCQLVNHKVLLKSFFVFGYYQVHTDLVTNFLRVL